MYKMSLQKIILDSYDKNYIIFKNILFIYIYIDTHTLNVLKALILIGMHINLMTTYLTNTSTQIDVIKHNVYIFFIIT